MAIAYERAIESYKRLGNIWKVAEEVGVCGETVRKYLKRAGIERKNQRLSDYEVERIREYYSTASVDDFSLDNLASELGRSKHLICRYARRNGLTDKSRRHSCEVREILSIQAKNRIIKYGHPRGATGLKHSIETKQIISQKSKNSWDRQKLERTGNYSDKSRKNKSDRMSQIMSSRQSSLSYTRGKGGIRKDICETWFRSSWEANYARYLNLLKSKGIVERWEYEKHTFRFHGNNTGPRSYLPDFAVYYCGEEKPVFVEVKGWLREIDRLKWKLMDMEYPEVELVIVDEDKYKAIKSIYRSHIIGWER